MWWNYAIGGSMVVSSISSLINTMSNIFMPKNNSNYQSNNYGSNFINQDHMYLRLSKYPSKSTIGYGIF